MRKYVLFAAGVFAGLANAQNIFTIAGIGYSHRDDVDGQPALNAPLAAPYAMLVDKVTGRLLFNDSALVFRFEPDGTLLTIAGGGPVPTRQPQFAPTAVKLASAMSLFTLRGMAQDSTGALYISDASGSVVYRVATDGTFTTFAGGGGLAPGFQSDGGPATSAALTSPRGLVFDSKGNLDIAEVFCNCIRQVSPAGIITTLYTLPPSKTRSRFTNVEGLAIDAQDNLYVSEWFENQVIKISANGSSSTTVAGTSAAGFSGDGGPATAAQLNGPSGVTLDQNGNLYIADSLNHRIRKIAADGTISTIAGTGMCGFSGDGGPATSAKLCNPAGTLFDASGGLLIADYGNGRVRRIAADGTIATIAGSGLPGKASFVQTSAGDGGPALHATFFDPGGTAIDSSGNLFVSETLSYIIRKIAPDGTIRTYAGTGQIGSTGDGGPARQAEIAYPGPLKIGPDGALYVVTGDSRVRKITTDGRISLVAGNGTGSGLNRSKGDGGPAVNATLNEPGEVAFDKQGDLYIADTSNARIRKVDQNGIITTVAGPGQQGVDYYNGVAFDGNGNMYVAWTHFSPPNAYSTLNRVNADGSFTVVAGNKQPCNTGGLPFTGDGQQATQVQLCAITSLSTDPNGRIIMSEGWYSLVLRLNADGTLQRLAGNTAAKLMGDGGPAVEASLISNQQWSPEAVTFDAAGNMIFGEPGINLIREVTNAPYTVSAVPDHIAASGFFVGGQSFTLVPNFGEPFPYQVTVSTTNGSGWLSTNRVTGLVGEPITVLFNPSRLAPGLYRGTVSVKIVLADGKATQQVDVPVTLTLP